MKVRPGETKRMCRVCGIVFPIDHFWVVDKKRNARAPRCRKCAREYDRKKYKLRKEGKSTGTKRTYDTSIHEAAEGSYRPLSLHYGDIFFRDMGADMALVNKRALNPFQDGTVLWLLPFMKEQFETPHMVIPIEYLEKAMVVVANGKNRIDMRGNFIVGLNEAPAGIVHTRILTKFTKNAIAWWERAKKWNIA